jgi:hypothetical protein
MPDPDAIAFGVADPARRTIINLANKIALGVIAVGLVALAAACAGAGEPVATPAPGPDLSRCLDVPRQLRDGIASGLNKPGIRLGAMQAVKSNDIWAWPTTGRSETVYWVAAALDGPKGGNRMATWSVFRSLSDPGLTWAGDSHARQTSTWGSEVPLEMRRSLPNDGWNEAQDCIDAAEAR